MKLVSVGKTHFAKVDTKDWAHVNIYKWYVLKSHTTDTLYAARYWYDEEHKHHSQLLHNFIMGYKGIDHINGDGLDCQRRNLRPANKSQNAANTGSHKDNTSGHKGVYLDKRDGTWYSQIMCQGKTYNLGRFKEKEDAITAYNNAARKLFGSYVRVA